MTALRLLALTVHSVAVGSMWYWKLSMVQLERDYSPAVLAAAHYQRPGFTVPVLLTIGRALYWRRAWRDARRHEDDPL